MDEAIKHVPDEVRDCELKQLLGHIYGKYNEVSYVSYSYKNHGEYIIDVRFIFNRDDSVVDDCDFDKTMKMFSFITQLVDQESNNLFDCNLNGDKFTVAITSKVNMEKYNKELDLFCRKIEGFGKRKK